jgi:hypothetical protein
VNHLRVLRESALIRVNHFPFSPRHWPLAVDTMLSPRVHFGPIPTAQAALRETLPIRKHIARWSVVTGKRLLTASDLDSRKAAWRHAYLSTPHGHPVELQGGQDRCNRNLVSAVPFSLST